MTDDPVWIEEAKRSDAEAFALLASLSFPAPWSVDGFVRELSRPDCLAYRARDEAGLAQGYLLARLQGPELEIFSVAVRPEARRAGLGRRLLEAALRRAGEAGAEVAHLEVRAQGSAARLMYLAAGFEVVGRRPRYYADGEDALLMSRSGLGASAGGQGPASTRMGAVRGG